MLPDYEIACEHEHSNCLLIAHKKVRNLFSPNIKVYRLRLCNDVFMRDVDPGIFSFLDQTCETVRVSIDKQVVYH